ncbi:hypothetical protein PGSY75_0604300 [Plasmodium gaboni]|uniref:Uncharacterized protein n=1 Tax=Plasmodium gaboni TaxID=647221 RepID=A0A151LRB3_9APIC|nr:hypothetical protein PGSY75_0604300 [Plasmodium gaboni]KYO01736.1 hypothetical protein PGSY75_0604300 [Plasmodium gaboni]
MPMSPLNASIILTNSNNYKNADDVFEYFSHKINDVHISSSDTHIHEELLGGILYIGIILRRAQKLSSNHKNILNWIEYYKNCNINVDLVHVNENKNEVSTLDNKFNLMQENFFHKDIKTIHRKIIGKKKIKYTEQNGHINNGDGNNINDDDNNINDDDNNKNDHDNNKNDHDNNKNDHDNNKNDDDNNKNDHDNNNNHNDKGDYVFFNMDRNDQHPNHQLEKLFFEKDSSYLVHAIMYVIELPLSVSQKYLHKKLNIKVQLVESKQTEKTKNLHNIIDKKVLSELKNIMHAPSSILNNIPWSSTFTSNMLYEKKRRAKKIKKHNDKMMNKESHSDHNKNENGENQNEHDDKNYDNIYSDDNNYDDEDDYYDDMYSDDNNDNNIHYNDEDDNYDSNIYNDFFSNTYDDERNHKENEKKFPLNVNPYNIYKSLNKYDDYMFKKNIKKNTKCITLNKQIIVIKPLNIQCKIIDNYLFIQIENITKHNLIHIHELFSRSISMNSNIFPLNLYPEDMYSIYYPIVNFVQILSLKNVKNKQKKKEQEKKKKIKQIKEQNDITSVLAKKKYSLQSEIQNTDNDYNENTNDNIKVHNETIYNNVVENFKNDIYSYNNNYHDDNNNNEYTTFSFNNDKTIISLSIKWCIDNTSNNFIWSQYCMEVEVPTQNIFNLEISFVKEINYSSILIAIFSFFNNHHEDIHLIIEIQDDNNLLNNHMQHSLISFNSSIDVGIIHPQQRKSVRVKMLAIMLGLHNIPYVKIKDKLTNKYYFVDLGTILVTE